MDRVRVRVRVRVRRSALGPCLPCEGLMELDDVHVAQLESRGLEHGCGSIGRAEQELLEGIARREGVLAQVRLGQG